MVRDQVEAIQHRDRALLKLGDLTRVSFFVATGLLAAFSVMLLHFMVLYRTRVRAPTFASLGAAFSAMALRAIITA